MATLSLDCASASVAAKGASLGEVLDSLSSLQPHTIELPEAPTAMQTCGDGVVVGLSDGKVLLVCVSPTPTSYCLESATPQTSRIDCLAVCRNREMCLSGANDGCVKLWSLMERKELATLSGHSKDVKALLITPNDLFGVSTGSDTVIKVWDLQGKCEFFSLEGHTDQINCLAVSADSRFLYSGDESGSIKMWNLEERKEITTLSGHTKCKCLTLSPDNQLLCSGSYTDIRIWNLADQSEIAVLHCQSTFEHIRFVQKGQICLLTFNGLELWNLSTNQQIATMIGHTSYVSDLAVFQNETFCLTSSNDKTIRMWDLENCEEVAVFQGHEEGVYRVQLTEDKQHFVSGSWDKTLKVWNVARRRERQGIEGFENSEKPLAVTQDLAITAEGGFIKLFSLKDCQQIAELKAHMGFLKRVKALLVTPDQKTLISSGAECTIKVWTLETRTLEHTFEGLEDPASFLAVTPDGRHLISAALLETGLTLWSIEEKCEIGRVSTKEKIIQAVIIRPDGQCAVCAHYKGVISIWSLPELKSLGKFTAHNEIVTGLAFTPDGKTLVSCGNDAAINLWHFDQRSLFATLQGHSKSVISINMCPNGLYVISSSTDSTVRVWSLEEKREFACYRHISANACFSTDCAYVISSKDNTVHLTPFIVVWQATDTAPVQATSETIAIVRDLASGKPMGKVASNWLVAPYRVNSLHISAFYNHTKRAQEYLAAGVPFIKGAFGSPLTVALQRKTMKCIEVFLNYLINLAKETHDDLEWPAFACIGEDIPILLRCGSTLLRPFFEVLMQPPATPVLPYFITPKSELPMVIISDSRLLQISEFDSTPKGEMGSELVKFNISLMRQNLTFGSAPSLELVEALQACEDKTVLNTPYISTIIEEKWAYFYPFTLTLTLLYAAMLTSLVLLLFNMWDTTLLSSAFIAINAFFVVYEMAQMLVDKWAYWMDPWNYVDIFRVFLSLFWGTLLLLGKEQSFLLEYRRDIRLILALLCLLRGFTYFRSFRTTRLFVYMTMAVIKEMYSFLFIMAYSVFAFGVCTSVLLEHTTLGESWTSAFSLVLGDFDSSTFGFLEWVVFSCAAIINVVIMLNLLVSILGDAYEMTQMSVRENDLYMMLELVNEYESLMFWRRSAGTPVIMFTCDRAIEADSAADWAGQVSKITEKVRDEVEKSTETIQGRVEALKGAQEKSIEALKKTMKAQNSELKNAVKTIEEKLEVILVLLKDRS